MLEMRPRGWGAQDRVMGYLHPLGLLKGQEVKVLYGKVIIREKGNGLDLEIKDGKTMEDVVQKELLVLLEGGSGYLLQRKLNGKVGIIAEVMVSRCNNRHRRRIMKEAEEAFQLELNRLNQAGGSYSDEASFRTAQSVKDPAAPKVAASKMVKGREEDGKKAAEGLREATSGVPEPPKETVTGEREHQGEPGDSADPGYHAAEGSKASSLGELLASEMQMVEQNQENPLYDFCERGGSTEMVMKKFMKRYLVGGSRKRQSGGRHGRWTGTWRSIGKLWEKDIGSAGGITERNDGKSGKVVGHVVVYVDDMMVCGPDSVVQGCLDRIAKEWSCSQPEWVCLEKWIKFCGFELRWGEPVPFSKPEVPEGLSYERCVGGRGVDGALPFAHAMNRIELYAYAPGGGRSHQGVMACYGGSLVQWLSVRQAFTTLSTAEAELVGYLEAMTMGQSVAVVLGILENGAWDDLLVDVAQQQDLVYSDLVQHGERLYEGEVQDVDAPLGEEHEKKQLLAEDREGAGVHCDDDRKRAQAGQDSSIGGGGDFVVYGDNSSAITIIGSADGPWRTRHLRLRAEVLREKVKGGRWAVRHLPGTRLVADHLTKAMTAKAQWPKFYELAGMVKVDVEKVEASSTEWRSTENVNKLKLAGLGLIMGKVASWTPENCQEKEAKTLCLAALGVGVAYVATLITRGHCGAELLKRVENLSVEEEPEDFWDVQTGEAMVVLTLEQRRQTSVVYEDVNMGRRLINDQWTEDNFRFGPVYKRCELRKFVFCHLGNNHRGYSTEEREDHWEVEFREDGLVVATRVHEVERIRSYQPERRDLPAGLFLEDFEDRRESFINPVDHREEVRRGVWTQIVEDNWRRDVWLREGWVGSSRFWVRPRRRIVVLQSGRPLTDQERQDEMDEDGAGESGTSGPSASSATAASSGSTIRAASATAGGDQKRPRNTKRTWRPSGVESGAIIGGLTKGAIVLMVFFGMINGAGAQGQDMLEEDSLLVWMMIATALMAIGFWELLRRYFKNMAEQSWRRHYFLERREEVERGAHSAYAAGYVASWRCLGTWQRLWPGKSRRRIIVKCDAKGECSGEGDTILEISKHKGKTYFQIACEHPDFVRWAVRTARSQEVDSRLAHFVEWATGSR
ncbi:unnamed protein product [Effrenium voratum]|uniref:Uncharacterized protein n=1 Tax=Effrenium voratum TaxID=2562239 RepID=A0AA36NGW8_9DINO|nr:unnamed protein product [Effrenium voratum]